MLKRLYIKDFTIVDELEVEFSPGFQVLTGETGAGKSILVGALGLICGERGQTDLVRAGAKKAILEAEFQLTHAGKKQLLLSKLEVDTFDDMLIIRREISEKGISRAFINDSPVNINTLGAVTGFLIDLHGQHQHQRLIHPENHMVYLDAFGNILPLLEEYKIAYQNYKEQKKLLLSFIEKRKSSYEKHDLYTFQVAELAKVNLQEGELTALISERRILENTEALYDITDQVSTILYSDENSASNKVAEAINRLKPMAEIDPSFLELITNLKSAQVSVEETGRFCETYRSNLEFNPGRLEEIQKRESDLDWLLKKYQIKTIEDLIKRRDEMKKELDEIENFDGKIETLEKNLEESREKLQSIALDLSEKRKKYGEQFGTALESLLASVGLNHARFEVKIQWQESESGIICFNGKKYDLSEDGLDRVEFFVGLNIGEPSRPLYKVASGGEVSRIMLSIKTLLADTDDIDTLVFDEIDSGISGRFAQIVGRKMREIAQHRQLVVITHLPQIAAQGDVHYAVIKEEIEGRARVDVQKLNKEERALDIAKLLGGEKLTPQAIANARELLEQNDKEHI
jgi:DNA repair protein RecN (Recombination protein N)